jgi:ubiquinone/menaquinone biosynthesis C-methylase UbiE
MPKYLPEEITHELFGIDPEKFYAELFSFGRDIDRFSQPANRYEISHEKIRLMVDNLKRCLPKGGDVLDVGCGSGPFGPTILAHVPGVRLFGVDMSRKCVKGTSRNGYTESKCSNLAAGLPYQDARFDAVISMDLLGHIEFRHKDALIREMSRVTRPGGIGHHGAETGFIDYLNCNPADPNDLVRKYVLAQGHIGTEPARHLERRFSTCFSEVKWDITYVYPFLDIDNIASADYFERDFHETLRLFPNPEARLLCNVVIGRFNTYFINLYKKLFGKAFQPYDDPAEQQTASGDGDPVDARVTAIARELCRPAGFASFLVRK